MKKRIDCFIEIIKFISNVIECAFMPKEGNIDSFVSKSNESSLLSEREQKITLKIRGEIL